jgi:hypothetical protein
MPKSTLKLPNVFLTRPARSAMGTRIPAPPTTRHLSRTYALFKKDWKGADSTEHSIKRARRNDTEDPVSEATASGMKEREGNEGIADDTKQQGTTERGGRKHGQKAKEEHPAAPEPVIGMNDERARVRGDFFRLCEIHTDSIFIMQKGN